MSNITRPEVARRRRSDLSVQQRETKKQECSRVLTEGRQEISLNGVSLAAVNQEVSEWLARVGLSLRSRRRSGPRSRPDPPLQDAEDERQGACLPQQQARLIQKSGSNNRRTAANTTRSAAWRAFSAPFPTTQGRPCPLPRAKSGSAGGGPRRSASSPFAHRRCGID